MHIINFLLKISKKIDQLNNIMGKVLKWLVVLMVSLTFVIVVLRYVFSLGWVWLQEIVIYTHALLFLSLVGYTFFKNEHVRVDVFSNKLSPIKKSYIEILGVLFFVFPTCGLIFWQSLPYIVDSWQVFEGSKDGGGIEAVFILKSFIMLFAVSLFLQGLSRLIKHFEIIFGGENG